MSVRLSEALGAAVAVLGLAALAWPGLATPLPASETVVVIVGGLLVLGAVSQFQRRRHAEIERADTPDVEASIDLPTPGDEFDRRLNALPAMRHARSEREHLRDAVGDAAVETIRRRERCSREEAAAILREGDWTDDPVAASFFTRRPARRSLRGRIRSRLRPEPSFRRKLRRAVAELNALPEDDDER